MIAGWRNSSRQPSAPFRLRLRRSHLPLRGRLWRREAAGVRGNPTPTVLHQPGGDIVGAGVPDGPFGHGRKPQKADNPKHRRRGDPCGRPCRTWSEAWGTPHPPHCVRHLPLKGKAAPHPPHCVRHLPLKGKAWAGDHKGRPYGRVLDFAGVRKRSEAEIKTKAPL